MSASRKEIGALVAVVLTLAGCSENVETEHVETEHAAESAFPDSGFVPYPILYNHNFQPVLGNEGQYLPGWDGTVADLIAADAYAACAVTGHYSSGGFGTWDQNFAGPGEDAYLQYLVAKMGQVECSSSSGITEVAWSINRADRNCNLDSRSGELTKLDDFQRDPGGYASLYSNPNNLSAWGLQGPVGEGSVTEAARDLAAREIEYADLNLCMAQYMRERTNSGQSLFASSTDLTEILALIRERAQLASLYYALLAKIASYKQESGNEPTAVTSGRNDWMVVARRWVRDIATETDLTRIGEDFATSVRLMVQSTHELGAVLERSAGQRPVGTSGVSRAQRDWGVGQPRIRLMNLLYGGDPIGQSDGAQSRGRGSGGMAWYTGTPPFVSTDMRDPRVGTLLGLARAADAVDLRNGLGSFDAETSAVRLYQSVEVALRVQECERQDLGGDCDPADIRAELPTVDQFSDYVLWQKYSIEPGVAEHLVEALAQAFGEFLRIGPEAGRFDGLMHLTGEHSTVTIDGAYWTHLDPNFGTAPLAGHELGEDYARLFYFPERLVLDANPYDQGFTVHGGPSVGSKWAEMRELGTIPALAAIREAIAEGSLTEGSPATFFSAVSVILPEIDREIGARSVIVRPVLEAVTTPCPSDPRNVPGSNCQNLQHAVGAQPRYHVSSTTRGEDPLVELTLAPRSRQIDTIALDPNTVSFEGVSRADLDGYPVVEAEIEPLDGYASGYQKRVFEYELASYPARRLLLKGQDPGGGANDNIYMPLIEHILSSFQSYPTSLGGELNGLGETTMRTLPGDWSRPAYDAFGLPADWVPPSDASLAGGSPGEQSYTYYLRVARQAAEEATAAVQVAVDNLILETEQRVDLEAAEQRAETIAGVEVASICGTSERCTNLGTVGTWLPLSGDCTIELPELPDIPMDCELEPPMVSPQAGAEARCEEAMSARDELIPTMPVTDEAYFAFTVGTPAFADYAGSELQGVLIRQWNAMKTLALVDASFSSHARALGIEVAAAEAQLASAWCDRAAADAQMRAALVDLEVEDMEAQGQLDALYEEEAQYYAAYNTASAKKDLECSSKAMDEAKRAGYSFAGAQGVLRPNQEEFFEQPTDFDSKSWSPGPMYAQQSACKAATIEFEAMLASDEQKFNSIQSRLDALLRRIGNPSAVPPIPSLSDAQREALLARNAAGHAAYNAAALSASATVAERWAQVTGSLSELQAAIADVLASQAEFNHLDQRLEGINAEEALEKDLAEKQAESRFGIQRKFRSYDMWRARALLESARRLAVAARRAVEAHFVVDLSDLDATQAFVESPALWADEIYGSDLDAPSVVGLSAAPKIEGAVFPNKLIDYVENLERFVQGYTISYPTSLAQPDTEVLTLPGPDVREMLPSGEDASQTSEGNDVEVLSAASRGWSFYCPATRAWLPHPGIGELPLEHTLETLCGEEPAKRPTRARFGFTLDPWGRLGGDIAADPLEQRHNVRWTRLAVNLVGVGIRDCEQAADPLLCHSEPFLRYNLKHVGPAWTTNHAEEWRAFNMPTALIEDAKALAAEEWLDPLANNWSAPLVSSAARAELFGRSIGGSYVLELELGPEVELSRIERVQLLVETQYWVRQE